MIMEKVTVFLGGTCNGSTWRDELLQMINPEKIDAFNPVVEHWDEKAQIEEDYHKANDDYCLYVLTPEMKGVYGVFEVALDAGRRPGRVIFCALPKRGDKEFDPFVQKNILKMKKDLVLSGVMVCEDLNQVASLLEELSHQQIL